MIAFLFKLFLKSCNFVKKFKRITRKNLHLQNSKSNTLFIFKLDINKFLDISQKTVFNFIESATINQNNFITATNNPVNSNKNNYTTHATISCLGEGMKIFDHNHKHTKNQFSVSQTEFNIGKIELRNNVWTDANMTILKDVTVGNNVILDTRINNIMKQTQQLVIQSL